VSFFHHSCIALYYGNNEIDAIYTVANSTEKETSDLRKLFGRGDDILPEEVKNYLWMMYSRIFLDICLCKKKFLLVFLNVKLTLLILLKRYNRR